MAKVKVSKPVQVAEAPISSASATVEVAEAKPVRLNMPIKKAEPYFLGVIDECPYQNLYLGGVTFHRVTNELMPAVRGDEDILAPGPDQRGDIEMLTPEQIEKVKKAAKSKIMRWYDPPRWDDVPVEGGGTRKIFKGRGQIFSNAPRHPEAPQFTPMPNDEPIGKYVYLMPVNSIGVSLLSTRNTIPVITLHEAMQKGTI